MLQLFIALLMCMTNVGNCEENKMLELKKKEGVRYITLDNGYKVWTQTIGHGPIKILTLHGGPGFTHEYLECMEDFFPKDQYQLIFYDQLGSHYSDQPQDVSLWTLDRFCEEVEQVRNALGLNKFYLYGQSWGALLAIEYGLKYQQNLKGLILSNITGSIDSYMSYIDFLRKSLPKEVQDQLKFYEDNQDFLNPAYEKIMLEQVYTRYLCRLQPWPEPFVRTFAHGNLQVYHTVQGPNEFIISGNIKNWDRWNDFHKILVPTLVICGRYDTMNPEDSVRMAKLLPNATLKICENGSHGAMYDDQEAYFEALHSFFHEVEKMSNLKF